MGVLKQGILGGFSGKVANIIGTSWKGISVIKAMPLSVANPKTASQVAQRALFKNCSLFGVIILATILKPLWDRFAIKMSGFNAFVRENIDLFGNTLPIPPDQMVISKGKMQKTDIASFTAADVEEDVTITWANDAGSGYKLATDVAYIVVFNIQSGDIVGFDGTGTAVLRSSTTVTITLPTTVNAGEVLHAYLAFKRADGTIVSNSSHKEETCPA